jgi:multiple antibiotic resistance protein
MISLEIFFHYMLVIVGGLLPIANPFSTAPLYLALTQRLSPKEQLKQADLACLYMVIILLVFLFFGAVILGFFGITIPGIRIAGGLVIMYIGFGMLFPQENQLPPEVMENIEQNTDFAFSPLAMPMLSGPGAIAVILGFSAQISQLPQLEQKIWGFIIGSVGIIVTAAICWFVLRAARRIVPLLGKARIDALTRMLGFLLICIGVQFAANGTRAFITSSMS